MFGMGILIFFGKSLYKSQLINIFHILIIRETNSPSVTCGLYTDISCLGGVFAKNTSRETKNLVSRLVFFANTPPKHDINNISVIS
jgi:hypothetical protein